jgi:DNA-directed RNA polymerase specialized sigma24 family protein
MPPTHNDSEDIYQETSLKVYAKRSGVPFECYFSTRIYAP